MNTIVAVPFDDGLADFIGKKGSENSITFYNRKLNDNVIVVLMPSSIEEKFYALPQCMLIADQILVSTKAVDKALGEVLVACSILGKRTIFTKDNDISALVSGMQAKEFLFCAQEELLDTIASYKGNAGNDVEKRVDIDKAFNVKGIGAVILGIVTKGTIKVHDTLYHNSGKAASIRSIQSQDEDVKEAGPGTRVGLAIKGMEHDEFDKGDVLASKKSSSGKRVEFEFGKSAFAKEDIEEGKIYSIATGFSYSSATMEGIDRTKIKAKLEKSITANPGDKLLLVRAMVPRIFASGVITKISD